MRINSAFIQKQNYKSSAEVKQADLRRTEDIFLSASSEKDVPFTKERILKRTEIQENLEKQPYNKIFFSNGRQVEVTVDDSYYGEFRMTKKEKEETKLNAVKKVRDKSSFLSSLEEYLPENIGYLNLTDGLEISYDREKKCLNIPDGKLNKRITPDEEGVKREIIKAVHPGFIEEKERLSALGIKWTNNRNTMSISDEMKVMKTLEKAASKVVPGKRTRITAGILEPQGKSNDGDGGGYNYALNSIVIYQSMSGENFTMDQLKDFILHEYGHAVSDTDRVDEKGAPVINLMTDSRGEDLTEKAVALEEKAIKEGQNPRDVNDTDSIFDKYDPYVKSHPIIDDEGIIVEEKYARRSASENNAETFAEYVNHPGRFRGKIKAMGEEMSHYEPQTMEYSYLSASHEIISGYYDYFKNNIFCGYEFDK